MHYIDRSGPDITTYDRGPAARVVTCLTDVDVGGDIWDDGRCRAATRPSEAFIAAKT